MGLLIAILIVSAFSLGYATHAVQMANRIIHSFPQGAAGTLPPAGGPAPFDQDGSQEIRDQLLWWSLNAFSSPARARDSEALTVVQKPVSQTPPNPEAEAEPDVFPKREVS